MQDQELRDLRRELAAHQRGPGIYYPDALRERITNWARRQLAAGATAGAATASLGIGRDTLRRWLMPASTALVPVEVVDVPRAMTVSVVSPSGFRIDGLTIDDAIAVLRRLG